MKLKLLIATADSDYAEHLSGVLSEKHADAFEVVVCTSEDRLHGLFSGNRFEVALADPDLVPSMNLGSVKLPLVLADEREFAGDIAGEAKKICKYQRISSMVGNIFEHYSQISGAASGPDQAKAHIAAAWSPSGGSGKTTVALAYAAYQVSKGKKATYLSLENFASASAYFQGGKSISKIFEKFDSNVRMFLAAIKKTDAASGISYFGEPENYEDINILSPEDIENLISACACETEELIVDLPSACDGRAKKVFDLADAVLLVCDSSATSREKLRQFMNQHDVFGKIQPKIVLVNNKGAGTAGANMEKSLHLPFVQSPDPAVVFKTLSSENFEW